MENVNKSINCCVTSCCHNCRGKNCQLQSIDVTEDCKHGTCCGSFKQKH